eukprot:TRINITY_DN25678_c0_g1_i1.p1 TRINITY_DN25678_c0_g1~~TRINITY_DN25678_c0_g1_i1.p1  ORF type:complete len:677 (-),score=161.76 TRINITY_DN25678_c0_g1_i1:62-2092(-)
MDAEQQFNEDLEAALKASLLETGPQTSNNKDNKNNARADLKKSGITIMTASEEEQPQELTLNQFNNHDMFIHLPENSDLMSKYIHPAQYGSKVLSGFKKLFNDQNFSDLIITLTCPDDENYTAIAQKLKESTNENEKNDFRLMNLIPDEEKLYAHKMVLSVWSLVFSELVTEQETAKQSKKKKNKKGKRKSGGDEDDDDDTLTEIRIEIPKNDREVFKNMIKYMYTAETDFITDSNILRVISISDHFRIDSLKEVCGELLGCLVDGDNLCFFLDICDRFNVKSLETSCGITLAENFEELLSDNRLMSLPPTTWAQIIRSDDIQVKSEEHLFDIVLKYSEIYSKYPSGRAYNRTEILALLLPHIRYSFMTAKFLTESVESNPALAQNKKLMEDILFDCYKQKLFPNTVRFRTSFRFTKPEGPASGVTNTYNNPNNIKITNEGSTCSCTTGGWYNVSCDLALFGTHNYFEVQISNPSSPYTSVLVMVGIVRGKLQGQTTIAGQYAGQWTTSWQWYTSGQIYHAGSAQQTTQVFNINDKVGVAFDQSQKNVSRLGFFKNGKLVTTLTAGLPTRGDKSEITDIYPVVSFSGVGQAQIMYKAQCGDDSFTTKGEMKRIVWNLGGKKWSDRIGPIGKEEEGSSSGAGAKAGDTDKAGATSSATNPTGDKKTLFGKFFGGGKS